jgi:hypothetical protein
MLTLMTTLTCANRFDLMQKKSRADIERPVFADSERLRTSLRHRENAATE